MLSDERLRQASDTLFRVAELCNADDLVARRGGLELPSRGSADPDDVAALRALIEDDRLSSDNRSRVTRLLQAVQHDDTALALAAQQVLTGGDDAAAGKSNQPNDVGATPAAANVPPDDVLLPPPADLPVDAHADPTDTAPAWTDVAASTDTEPALDALGSSTEDATDSWLSLDTPVEDLAPIANPAEDTTESADHDPQTPAWTSSIQTDHAPATSDALDSDEEQTSASDEERSPWAPPAAPATDSRATEPPPAHPWADELSTTSELHAPDTGTPAPPLPTSPPSSAPRVQPGFGPGAGHYGAAAPAGPPQALPDDMPPPLPDEGMPMPDAPWNAPDFPATAAPWDTPLTDASDTAAGSETATPPPPASTPAPAKRRPVAAVLTFVFACAAAGLGYLAYDNSLKSLGWERAYQQSVTNEETLTANADVMEDDIDALLDDVAQLEQALARSEADVARLETELSRESNENEQFRDIEQVSDTTAEAVGAALGRMDAAASNFDVCLVRTELIHDALEEGDVAPVALAALINAAQSACTDGEADLDLARAQVEALRAP